MIVIAKDDRYILDAEGNPVAEPDLIKWAKWFNKLSNRVLASDHHDEGKFHVSTVFLGLDHGFGGSDTPVLWETMIFGGGEPYDGFQYRYTSKEAALAGHAAALAWVKGEGPEPGKEKETAS